MAGKTRCLAFVVGLFICTSVVPATASPIPPPPELWLMDADGTDQRKLETTSVPTGGFAWDQDGSRFAYTTFELFLYELASDTHTRLATQYPTYVKWSPVSDELLYTNGAEIRVVSPGGSPRTIVDPVGGDLSVVIGADWSPDASHVSFIAGPGDGTPGHLYVAEVATGTYERVGGAPAPYTDTDWSPTGEWIAYETTGTPSRPSGWINIVTPDGATERSVADELEVATDPHWSPDGRDLAYFGYTGAANGIHLFKVATGANTMLVPGGIQPEWSPDGTRILFTRSGNLFTVLRDGSAEQQLTSTDLRADRDASWSPDGSHIAFIGHPQMVLCPGFPYPIQASIIGTAGDDVLEGTENTDVIAGRGGNDTITGLGGNDFICGGDGDDAIAGGAGADRLYGEAGVDALQGEEDPDLLDGGDGSDELDGGTGTDVLSYLFAPRAIEANLTTGLARGWGDDSFAGIENLAGSHHGDTLVGDGGPNVLWGVGDGWGRSGNDRLVGRGGDDELLGYDGRDELRGGTGADVLRGGAGIDSCYGGRGRDDERGCEP